MATPIDEHDDDQPVGRVLTRREILALLGGTGAAMVIGGSLGSWARVAVAQEATVMPSCVVRPEVTEGPYFVDDMLNRSDIRIEPTDESIKEGTVLKLIFRVSDVSANTCLPLAGAQVDVWHCDALGVYSGVNDPGFDTSAETWLRGYQVTDENGLAEFITIYPGWYSGRTTHIHFKIRTDPEADSGYEFTSQLFFDEAFTDVVHTQEPYASKGYRDTLNDSDNIFQGSEGLLTLDVQPYDATLEATPEATAEPVAIVYTATFDIGLDLSQPSASDSFSQPGGGRRPGA